jgi:hypothetical protein
MKKSNEQKNNFVQRLLTSALNFNKEKDDSRSKSPVHKFEYELPESFFRAVDNARIEAGYDILPRHRHRSTSPLTRQGSSSSSLSPHRTVPKMSRSSSANDIHKISTKKVQFRRTPRAQINHHHQRTIPIPFSSRPPFRMMTNPNFMMRNRFSRPPNIMAMRSPILMQQRQIFRLRFR